MKTMFLFFRLHDRRLCVLGLCLIISLPVDKRTDAIVTFSEKYIPSLLLLFSGLKKAYATKASNQNEDGRAFSHFHPYLFDNYFSLINLLSDFLGIVEFPYFIS